MQDPPLRRVFAVCGSGSRFPPSERGRPARPTACYQICRCGKSQPLHLAGMADFMRSARRAGRFAPDSPVAGRQIGSFACESSRPKGSPRRIRRCRCAGAGRPYSAGKRRGYRSTSRHSRAPAGFPHRPPLLQRRPRLHGKPRAPWNPQPQVTVQSRQPPAPRSRAIRQVTGNRRVGATMPYTLEQAARAIGKAKPTMLEP